jgi:hypothetical protein
MTFKRVALALVVLLIAVGALGGNWVAALANSEPDFATFSLTYQQPADVYLGKGGVFMVSSGYDGSAVIHRIEPEKTHADEDLRFIERWIEFHVFSPKGATFTTLYGLNYVYFNLTKLERLAWEDGNLNIYRYDRYKFDWVECPTHLVEDENRPHGRLSCVMTDFGLYGLAELK